jgi:hypothetical protein
MPKSCDASFGLKKGFFDVIFPITTRSPFQGLKLKAQVELFIGF